MKMVFVAGQNMANMENEWRIFAIFAENSAACALNVHKKNIARIAKAALHKLPGKSSSIVRFACPVCLLRLVCPVCSGCPVCPACPDDHNDHEDHDGYDYHCSHARQVHHGHQDRQENQENQDKQDRQDRQI